MILRSVVDAIGNTPLVALDRLCKSLEVKGRVMLKLEYLQPGASKKDRIAKQMLIDSLANGASVSAPLRLAGDCLNPQADA